MIIYLSAAKKLWPELMEFAEKKGKALAVTTDNPVVKENGVLTYKPMFVQYANRGPMRVPTELQASRHVALLSTESYGLIEVVKGDIESAATTMKLDQKDRVALMGRRAIINWRVANKIMEDSFMSTVVQECKEILKEVG